MIHYLGFAYCAILEKQFEDIIANEEVSQDLS